MRNVGITVSASAVIILGTGVRISASASVSVSASIGTSWSICASVSASISAIVRDNRSRRHRRHRKRCLQRQQQPKCLRYRLVQHLRSFLRTLASTPVPSVLVPASAPAPAQRDCIITVVHQHLCHQRLRFEADERAPQLSRRPQRHCLRHCQCQHQCE